MSRLLTMARFDMTEPIDYCCMCGEEITEEFTCDECGEDHLCGDCADEHCE